MVKQEETQNNCVYNIYIASDLAFDICSGQGAVGVVARNIEGKFMVTGYKRIRVRSIQEAELLGVEGALKLAVMKGFGKIHLEGDCQIVMKALKKKDQHLDLSWQDATIFFNILAFCLHF
ncbi:hypothetical protein FRX31_028066 [Thalictrum thalictroides]|uniref:RNase H type-1 domain-containing protein n=1 Tax=Thalictrum thalictroides TaxID=46969 RepID=A0A7J6VDP8_THATH|nr:hypothetical protein FRX31_028066 [Thalictrum thalictroides]